MRTALKNKQKLKYALYHERQEIYRTDAEGNIVYTEVDGERVPVSEGYSEHFYDEPVDFIGNIMPVGSESYARGNVAIYRPYGIDVSAYDALILMNRGELPITESSLIWEWHEPSKRITDDYFIEDADDDVVDDEQPEGIQPTADSIEVWDETTADWIVKRVASTQNITLYLLSRMNHNG